MFDCGGGLTPKSHTVIPNLKTKRKSYTLYFKLQTLNPKPPTLTLNPIPQTLNPTHYTLNPEP